jgi:acyl dehydratase
MEISSKYVGAGIREYRAEVSGRETMNYAAAVGDDNPHYFDDGRAGGIVAHPMFAVAVTWPLIGRVWEYLDAPEFPMEVLMTQVHYTEHLEFHRCIVPGDKLAVAGEVAAILPHRAGTHIVIKLVARDASGAPVFTEYSGAMLRGIKCSDAGAGGENVPALPECGAAAGVLWRSVVGIGRLAPFVYDGCSNIHFPIHTSVRFARSVGLPGIILQGTATLATAVREIIDREAGGDPRRLKAVGCRFSGSVLPGSQITVELSNEGKSGAAADLFFTVKNSAGENAIRNGFARING